MREQGRWHMAWPPALWSDPPFPASPIHGLMDFPSETCLVSCCEFSDRSLCCAGIPHPHPPGIVSISTSLFPAPCPELTNVCHTVLWASAQVLHQGRNRFCWSLHLCNRERRASHFGAKYRVLITEVLLSSFLNTGDIYKILSNILGAPLQIYTW